MKNFPFEELKSSALQLGDRLGSEVRSWRALPLTGILALLGLVVPVQIVHADLCALCEDRPHLCSPKTLESCKPCDEKLLKELKAKRDQKIKTYREIVAAAEETRQREAEALAKAQEIFGDYAKGIAEKGVVKVGKEVFKVPDEVVAAYKEAKITNSDKAASEKFLRLTKMYLEELFKHAGYKTAVTRAKWIDAAMSGALMDAMVLTKLKEAEFHAEQAYKQWLLGYETLMEARHLEDRIRKLEAECKAKGGGGGASQQEETESQSSGEREAEEAEKMLDGWKKVEDGFEDSEGNFHSADLAFEEALTIVQSQQSQQFDARPWFVTFGFPPRPWLVTDMTEAEMDAEWNKFREPLRRAFELVIKGMESYHRAEQQFYMLSGSPAPSGHQPAQSRDEKVKPCVGPGCKSEQPSPSRKTQPPIQISLALKDKTGPALGSRRIQWGEIQMTASVTGLPANAPTPLYQFALWSVNGGNDPVAASGEFNSNSSWTWTPAILTEPGWSGKFIVTVQLTLPEGTIVKTAEAGPYLFVDDAIARQIFSTKIGPVVTFHRCANCHNAGNSPTQGDDRHLHVPAVNRQTDCRQCHGNTNGTSPGTPPGAFGHWRMPPPELSFANKSAEHICRQIKDPARNGGRSLEELRIHVKTDQIIKWAWEPGPGRTKPPSTWEFFTFETYSAFQAWIRKGAACPESEQSLRK